MKLFKNKIMMEYLFQGRLGTFLYLVKLGFKFFVNLFFETLSNVFVSVEARTDRICSIAT